MMQSTEHYSARNSRAADAEAWYVIHTRPKQERRALEHLSNQGYACVLPLYQRERLRLGLRVLHEEPLFPRYLFIRLSAGTMNWHSIRSTRGVAGLVSFGGQPASVPEEVVESLLQRPEPQESLFNAGDRVMITAGPFQGFEGVFEQDDGSARVVILLEFMSKEQHLSLPVASVTRAG